MTTKESFEAWYDDEEITPLPDDYTILGKRYLYMGWCAATTEANKRIAELESEVAELKDTAEEWKTQSQDAWLKIAELQASNNRLREALEVCKYDCNTGEVIGIAREALAATPAESLQAHDDEFKEKLAKMLQNKAEEYGAQLSDDFSLNFEESQYMTGLATAYYNASEMLRALKQEVK